jgi:hypothetical protein
VDLIVSSINGLYGELDVLTNTGNGNFGNAFHMMVSGNPLSVKAADVNGDGKLDLITAIYNTNALMVLTNNGSGGFVFASAPTVGNWPVSVAAADVNGDGNVDLISANRNNNTLTVLSNTPASYQASFTGNGAGLRCLNAGNITSGTIADARLSANVALLNANQTFTGTNTFSKLIAGNGAGLTNLNASQLASGTLPSARLSGTYSGALTLNNAANSFNGAFVGNGAGLTNISVDSLSGALFTGTFTNATGGTLYITNGTVRKYTP